MPQLTRYTVLTLSLMIAVPSMAIAGPPLICHPFQTAGAPLLPWGSGPGWNTPERRYDVQRLTDDLLTLLDDEAPILARMENMRRAAIYAARDVTIARHLLTAVRIRAKGETPTRLALFDAGYLIETYKQATHLFGRAVTTEDGYALILRAIAMSPPEPEMDFAAALMTEGATASAHLRRARSAAVVDSLLASNIKTIAREN